VKSTPAPASGGKLTIEDAAAVKLAASPVTMPVERGKIREFARATGSEHPEYMLSERAVIPPTFLVTAGFFWGETIENPGDGPFGRIDLDRTMLLHAEEEVEFFGEPPRAGDLLHISSFVDDAWHRTKRSAGTPLTFLAIVSEFRTVDDVPVARLRTVVVYDPQ
jgi:hypothetical protein